MRGCNAVLACVLCAALLGTEPAIAAELPAKPATEAQASDQATESEDAAAIDAEATADVAPASVSNDPFVGIGEGAEEFGDAFASGLRSFAIGPGAWALGESSTAIGALTEVDGLYGLAVGYGAWARIDPMSSQEQKHQVAVGAYAIAWGQRAVAIGGGASAVAGWDSDFGALGTSVVAVGTGASASGRYATAVGDSAVATSMDGGSSAFGARAYAYGQHATAIGYEAYSTQGGTAVGAEANANSLDAIAVGRHAFANGRGAISLGSTDAADLNGDGLLNAEEITWANGVNAAAIGALANAQGEGAMALGAKTIARGVGAYATGHVAIALGAGASAFGAGAQATGVGSSAVGAGSAADGEGALAFGSGALAFGKGAGAVGFDSVAIADNSLALGAGSIADQVNTVSIGTTGAERRIVHVADGVDDTDAANYGQVRRLSEQLQGVSDAGALAVHYDDATRAIVTLEAGTRLRGLGAGRLAVDSSEAVNGAQVFAVYDRMATVFGANAAMDATFTGPSFVLDNGTFGDVGSALGALQDQSRRLRDRLSALETGVGPASGQSDYIHIDGAGDGSDVATGTDGHRGVAIGAGARVDAANGVAIGAGSVADRADSVSVGNATQQRQITHVARGTEANDAVTVEQMQDGDTQVYNRARQYVDLRVDQALAAPMAAIGELRTEMHDRFGEQDRRIDRQSAMTAAAMNMAGSAAGVRTANRVAVGAGMSNGEQALSVGYQRAISDRAAMTLGGAFSGSEQSAGVGFSFGW
ncbi:YadA-like family protein [Lysobacter sp. KIS68-7]|uniref:YadA C-terminal domain-containing protein n=1 Tax=Lysobacter sp. KIS68-7 TaxID=2904252 RepID=UPI001E3067DB|nr:YadA-like family protein [Lysobacter sp. KIS68-7]UHQ20739.1 YadA-like family protein [Lysobacter sp. KIS68-7]